MSCRATKLNIIFGLIITFVYALMFTSKVTAETSSNDSISNYDYPERSIGFEIKPVALLVNLVPGARGFAGEFEASLGQHVSVVAGLHHFSLNLSDARVEEQKTDRSVAEVEKDVSTSEVSLGGRYYSNIAGHSWFLGSKIGGGTKQSVWDHDSGEYTDSQMSYLIGADSGFRWLWKNSLHLRLGGGLEFRRTISRTINRLADDSPPDDVTRNIEKNSPSNGIQFNPYFDFGLGITI